MPWGWACLLILWFAVSSPLLQRSPVGALCSVIIPVGQGGVPVGEGGVTVAGARELRGPSHIASASHSSRFFFAPWRAIWHNHNHNHNHDHDHDHDRDHPAYLILLALFWGFSPLSLSRHDEHAIPSCDSCFVWSNNTCTCGAYRRTP